MRLAPAVLLLLGLIAAGEARADIDYKTEISGIGDKALRQSVEAISQLKTLEERKPASIAALRRRADDDLERLRQAIQAEGYWAPQLDLSIDQASDPVAVRVKVDPGPRYTLERVTLQRADGGTPPALERYHPIAFGLKLGEAARSAPILAAEPQIAAAMGRNGYPYAKVTDRRVVVDHGTRTVSVTYTVESGPIAVFGPRTIEGLSRVERGYVERRIAWREGERYDAKLVDTTRKSLVDSGLFTSVRITPPREPPEDGRVPMKIELSERLPRSIGAGVDYNTSQGFGVRAFWEHRNLFDGAEKLRISTDLAEQRQGVNATLRIPDFREIVGQDLVLSADLADESPEAYDSKRLKLFGGVERRFAELYTGGLGLQFEKATVTSPTEDTHYTLVGVPAYVKRDSTTDLLNPTSGTRSSWTVTPYTSVAGPDLQFVTSRVTGSVYRELDDAGTYVGAAFGALGNIFGEGRDTIPPDKRLYAGGGGSIRGFGYQRAGPLDVNNNPIGGRSTLELGTELRVKITDTIGVVPFVEAGNAYEGAWPGGKLLVGAGIGARYYTAVGPVRFDVAFPVTRRDSDAMFQLYISLGQAF